MKEFFNLFFYEMSLEEVLFFKIMGIISAVFILAAVVMGIIFLKEVANA